MSSLKSVFIPDEVVMSKIYVIRDQKVMLDEGIYIRIREMLLAHKDVFLRVEQVEKHLMKHDQKIELLFAYLSKFIEKEDEPRTEIGFKRKGK